MIDTVFETDYLSRFDYADDIREDGEEHPYGQPMVGDRGWLVEYDDDGNRTDRAFIIVRDDKPRWNHLTGTGLPMFLVADTPSDDPDPVVDPGHAKPMSLLQASLDEFLLVLAERPETA